MEGVSSTQSALLKRILSIYHPSWSSRLLGKKLPRPRELSPAVDYLERVAQALELFIPASSPEFGITERGGDAAIAYLSASSDGEPDFFLMLDVSGFTALLTFLTNRFGKQEAGDIMNLGILNRYCLNRIGILLHHFASNADSKPCSPAETALKTAFSFRAILGRVTLEVRDELGHKLAGKPHQHKILPFIKNLEIKASGGVVAAVGGGSGFYGKSHRVRITWGETARCVAAAEKVGGSDDLVDNAIDECKGVGLDSQAFKALHDLVESGWLKPGDFVLKKIGAFHKLVLTRAGSRNLARKVDHLFAQKSEKNGKTVMEQGAGAGKGTLATGERLVNVARHLEEMKPFLLSEELIDLTVRSLGSEGDTAVLFDERSSRIHDTGILFINFVVESEKLLDELAETVHEVMSRYGLIYKYNIFPDGDFNLMATLGHDLPGAPETDRFYAEVLWQCWSELLRAIAKEFGSRVGLRGGMSVGTCLQGPVGDNLINNEHTVIGPDCNLAARLLAQALQRKNGRFVFDSGTLVAASGCYRPLNHLVQPVEPFTRASLKGFSEPLPLYLLAERQSCESTEDFAARLRQLPLVTVEGKLVDKVSRMGSDSFLRGCLKTLEAIHSGRLKGGEVLAFCGPGGLGKTRRMAEIMAWCSAGGWKVLFGECFSWYQEGRGQGSNDGKSSAGSTAVPYHPFIRLMNEQIFGILPQDARKSALGKITESLSRLPDSLNAVEQTKIIASFLGLTDRDELPATLNPETRRNIFFERVADLLEYQISISGKGLLLCVDDLQWADKGTLKLLKFLLHRVNERFVLCVNARKQEQVEELYTHRIRGMKPGENLFLVGPLGSVAVEILTRTALGLEHEDELPEALLSKVVQGLENNPFFIIEFCNKIIEKEIAFVRDGRLLRLDEHALSRLSLPNRIQSVVESMVESVPKRDFDLVRYSSVLGTLLRCRHVVMLAEGIEKESSRSQEQMREALHRLAGMRILRIEEDRGVDSVYSFSRALIAEYLYQGLPPTLRKKLHAAAAEIFEGSIEFSPLEQELSVAMHYDLAEKPEPAGCYYLSAARSSVELFENEKVVELVDKVEKLCAEYRVDSKHNMMLGACLLRGEAALGLGKYDRALEDGAQARSLASRLRMKEDGVRAGLLAARTYLTRARQKDFSLALVEFQRTAKRAVSAGSESLQIEARQGRARVLLEMGRTNRALSEIESILQTLRQELALKMDEKRTLLTASLMRDLGSALHRSGKNLEATSVYDEALALVGNLEGDTGKPLEAMLLNSKALSLAASFQLDRALDLYAMSQSAARRVGDVNLQLVIRNNMGVALNDSGRNTEALDLLLSRYDSLKELAGENRTLAGYEFNIGESYHFMEQFERAEEHYRQSLKIADKIGSRQFAVNIIYNLGEVLRDQGRIGEAVEILARGLRISRRAGYTQQGMDIENVLGEMERDRGRLEQAIRRHRRCMRTAEELGDNFGRSWSMRNLAVDYLLRKNITPGRLAETRRMLFLALDLSHKSMQPENIMESLSRILEFRSVLSLKPDEWQPLWIELQRLVEKQQNKKYKEFCDRFKTGLKSAKGKGV
jgi:predicted ATPase